MKGWKNTIGRRLAKAQSIGFVAGEGQLTEDEEKQKMRDLAKRTVRFIETLLKN